jgi:hypothetical protein
MARRCFPKLQTFQAGVAIDIASVKRAEKLERLVHGDLVGKVRGLEANTDPVLEPLLLPIGIEVEDLHIARRPGPQTLEDLDRRGLAGAVRSEQAEDFPGPHFEVDPFDRFEIAVCLAQPAHVDCKFAVGSHVDRPERYRTI